MLVAEDPRVSPRPAEAVRVAAGVGAWKRAEILVYLYGPAVLVAAEYVDEWVDGDSISRYLPLLTEGGHPIYVEMANPWFKELGLPPVPLREVSRPDLAVLAASCRYVLQF
jgi:hypothetical protein